MTNRRSRTESPRPHELPHHRAILESTDWASLATVCGTGGSLPTTLARVIDPDPVVRTAAIDDALREVTHQNTIYEATVPVAPVACYVAAVLHHPVVAAGDSGTDAGMPPHRPTVGRLLEWLSDTAYDADDACVAISERHCGEGLLDEDRAMRAFRELRPALFSAVRPLLHGRFQVQ